MQIILPQAQTKIMVLFYVLLIAYLFAVNFYGVILLRAQRDEVYGDDGKWHSGDGKLMLTALLGGATGIFITMFLLRFRLKNMLLMLLLPVVAALNLWLVFSAFRSFFPLILLT